jgi:hypothetical protein
MFIIFFYIIISSKESRDLTHKVVVGKHLTKYEVNYFVNLVILFIFWAKE